MTNNEIISRARGECRHKWEHGGDHDSWVCNVCSLHVGVINNPNSGGSYLLIGKGISETDSLPSAPDYDNDPGAWTPELFQWIKDKWIKDNWLLRDFMHQLRRIILNERWRLCDIVGGVEFAFIKATPAQKADALARAIAEGYYGN